MAVPGLADRQELIYIISVRIQDEFSDLPAAINDRERDRERESERDRERKEESDRLDEIHFISLGVHGNVGFYFIAASKDNVVVESTFTFQFN